MPAKIGVGIVGLSAGRGWGAAAHVPALRALSDQFELRGLTGSSADSAKAAADRFSVPFFTTDAPVLAARPEIDLVVITVRVPEHRHLVEAALSAGKMVYCEWPLGRDLAEAEQMAALAREKQVKAVVGLQARSAPPVVYLRDLIKRGYVGEILSTTMIGYGGSVWGGTVHSTHSYVLDESTGATMLTIPLGHSVDALAWILGEFQSLTAVTAVRRATATIGDTGAVVNVNAPDQAAVAGTLENGAVASVHYRGGEGHTPGFTWEINGTDGDIVVKGNSGHLQFGLVNLSGRRGDEPLAPLPLPAEYMPVEVAADGMAWAVAHAYRNLLDDLQSDMAKTPTFDDAVLRHRMIAAIQASAANGRRESYL